MRPARLARAVDRQPATGVRLRRVVVAALAALAAIAPPGLATAGPREDALGALASPDVTQRRRAVQTLADHGVFGDVPALAQMLRDADDLVRGLADYALWHVWSRSGDPKVDELFAEGVLQITEHHVAESIETFTKVIQRKPEFAEGWNKRATAYFMLGQYERSLADCDEVVKRNPYHYGALSGYGMIYMQLDEPTRAIEYFERALAVNPNLHQVRETVDALKALVLRRRRDMI